MGRRPSCAIDGYVLRTHTSYNANDVVSFALVGSLLLGVVLLFVASRVPSHTRYMRAVLIGSGLTCILLPVIAMVIRPIRVIHIASSLISRSVKTPPFLSRAKYFPRSRELERPAFVARVQHELRNMLARTRNGTDVRFTRDTFGGENQEIGVDVSGERGWRTYVVKIGDDVTTHAQRDFPTLVRALRTMPEVRACVVSMLDGKTHIPAHVGYFKGTMRYMLALQVPQRHPERCYLCVNGMRYQWREGVGVLWDDTFPHRVMNGTDERRIVLYMDVLRPLQSSTLKWIRDAATTLFVSSPTVKAEIQRTERREALTTTPV